MTTRASIEKRIYNELSKSAEKQVNEHEFIPEGLKVRNVATYLSGANEEESKTRLFEAFHQAYHYAGGEDYDISSVRLASSTQYGYSKGALVFRAERIETDDEFDRRLRYEASQAAYKEYAPIYEKRRAAQALKNAQAEVARLSK